MNKKKDKKKILISICLFCVLSICAVSQSSDDFLLLKYPGEKITHYTAISPLEHYLFINDDFTKADTTIFSDSMVLALLFGRIYLLDAFDTFYMHPFYYNAKNNLLWFSRQTIYPLFKSGPFFYVLNNRVPFFNSKNEIEYYQSPNNISLFIEGKKYYDDDGHVKTESLINIWNHRITPASKTRRLWRNIYVDSTVKYKPIPVPFTVALSLMPKYLYTFSNAHIPGPTKKSDWKPHKDVNYIEKVDIETNVIVSSIATQYVFSRIFLGNDKRLVWLMGQVDSTVPILSHKEIYKGIKNRYYGIYYINLSDSFTQSKVKFNTGWINVKSDLDKYYTSLSQTDSIVSRYINLLGFKDNNILAMLRDKWVDTLTEEKERNDSTDYNFEWYETSIYTFDFDNPIPRWDTLNLHEAFSMLQVPEKWVVENREVGKPNYYANVPVDYYGIYKWSDHELAVALQPKDKLIINPVLENANRIFLIYNFDTKKWSKFEFPQELVPYYSSKMVTDLNGIKYFRITPADTTDTTFKNVLLKYTPKVSVVEETAEGIFMELGFRRLYPNPASHKVTADIMCYVKDRTKLDIGLYNLMGQKILDLSNNFEYSDATHTIYTTFNVSTDIPSGIYYLKVRNGTEVRTQTLVIGYK